MEENFYSRVEEALSRIRTYTKEVCEDVEKRVDDSIHYEERCYDVISTLLHIDELSFYRGEMFPVLEHFYEHYENEALYKRILTQKEPQLSTFFFKLSESEMTQLIESKRKLKATISSADKSVVVECSLKRSQEYMEKSENLYKLFLKNGLAWNSVNLAYNRKMVELYLTELPKEIYDLTHIEKIEFDFEELKSVVYPRYIPVWNIEVREYIPTIMVRPVGRHTLYEHQFQTEGFLTANDNCIFEPITGEICKRYINREGIAIALAYEKSETIWRLYRFHCDISPLKYAKLEFPMLSNQLENPSFELSRTQESIKALINSYVDLKGIEIMSIELCDGYEREVGVYDVNPFWLHELRLFQERKVMLITVKMGEEHFLSRDKISYLLGMVAMNFPEYRVRGKLL